MASEAELVGTGAAAVEAVIARTTVGMVPGEAVEADWTVAEVAEAGGNAIGPEANKRGLPVVVPRRLRWRVVVMP